MLISFSVLSPFLSSHHKILRKQAQVLPAVPWVSSRVLWRLRAASQGLQSSAQQTSLADEQQGSKVPCTRSPHGLHMVS